MKKIILPLVLITLGQSYFETAQALTIRTPIAATADATYSGPFDVTNLFDKTITEADIGTAGTWSGVANSNTNSVSGLSWAWGQSPSTGVVVLDMGVTGNFNGLLYAQRSYDGANLDEWLNVDVWGLISSPGAAGTFNTSALGAVQNTIPLAQNSGGTLTRYDFSNLILGQYVVLQFHNSVGAYPGGQELRLLVPEPSMLLLLGSAIAGLSLFKRSKRQA